MTLSFLLSKLGLTPANDIDSITLITDNPEEVIPGSIFVCIEGSRFDGHDSVKYAKEKGAVAVIGEKNPGEQAFYITENSRRAYSILCSAFYGDPQNKLKVIGITGTNGKTTTAEYIRYILNNSGHHCGSIGTLGCKINGDIESTGFTTPNGNALYGGLAKMVEAGCDCCVMEVSSQALVQHRVDPIRFDLGIFTNLGSEHQDYHKNMEAYIQAKALLAGMSDSILINSDDAYAEKFASQYKGNNIKYYSARNGLADFMAINISYFEDKVSYVLFGQSNATKVKFRGLGEFSVYNSLCAAASCLCIGVPFEQVCQCLNTLPQVDGRAQIFSDGRGFKVCVDYAHTPDALSSILLALQKITKGSIITVFGCGGDRDSLKRPLMGQIAANVSKTVIITSDNSRSEAPEKIICEIKAGIKRKADVFTEVDREKAIRLALNKAQRGDTVLVAGKGHESTLVLGNEKTVFSDIECVKNNISI